MTIFLLPTTGALQTRLIVFFGDNPHHNEQYSLVQISTYTDDSHTSTNKCFSKTDKCSRWSLLQVPDLSFVPYYIYQLATLLLPVIAPCILSDIFDLWTTLLVIFRDDYTRMCFLLAMLICTCPCDVWSVGRVFVRPRPSALVAIHPKLEGRYKLARWVASSGIWCCGREGELLENFGDRELSIER